MSRDDLRALTPDALAALCNRGLVKRAQKEFEAGQIPTLHELVDGTVVGRLGEIETKLVPGVPLRDAACTCGAAGVCRHKLLVVLAYASGAPTSATPNADVVAETEAQPVLSWSPGHFTDEQLLSFLGKRVWERARSLHRQGYVAEIRRVSQDNPTPTALLPTCSVRFLVPNDVSYAHCDSGERAMEAIALAVWAFRQADARDPTSLRLELEVGDATQSASSSAQLEPTCALVRELLLEGVVHTHDSLAGQFERVRQALVAARLIWPASILEDLQEQLNAYHARSARYNPTQAASLACELFARERAVRHVGELPPSRILGTEDAPETALDHLRLASLGARVYGDASYRLAEIVVADPDTSTVLVMRKEYPLTQDKPAPTPSELGRKTFAARTSLLAIAGGQVVTASARRGANRLLALGQSRVARTSVVPSNGDWSSFGEGLRVRDTNKLVFDLSQRPPTLLRPRLLSDGIYVLEVAAVDNLHYAPGAQCLSCVLTPPLGPPVRLVRTYDGAAPGALSDLAQALSGKAGALRFVSGSVRATSRGPEIEPIGVVTDRFHVPDLADPNDGIELLQSAAADTQDDHLKHALEEAARTLDDAAHHGLRRASRSYSERLQRQAYELRRTGLTQLALRFDALHSALNASLASGNLETETQLVTRWADAAIRVHLCQQQV